MKGCTTSPAGFAAGQPGQRRQVTLGGRQVPFGDLRFSCGGLRIGFEICEDAWTADRPGARLAARGIDVILNPSASHFAFGKEAIRQRFVLEGARAYAAAYVYANLLGNEAGRVVYDGSTLIAAPTGLVAAGRRFSFADMLVTDGVVDLDAIRLAQARFLQAGVTSTEDDVVSLDFVPSTVPPEAPLPQADRRDAWERSAAAVATKEEEFSRAVALGLIDTLRKSRSRGFVGQRQWRC